MGSLALQLCSFAAFQCFWHYPPCALMSERLRDSSARPSFQSPQKTSDFNYLKRKFIQARNPILGPTELEEKYERSWQAQVLPKAANRKFRLMVAATDTKRGYIGMKTGSFLSFVPQPAKPNSTSLEQEAPASTSIDRVQRNQTFLF
eukprot:5468837-Amphidinium_carterae.1